jgi:pectinesterase
MNKMKMKLTLILIQILLLSSLSLSGQTSISDRSWQQVATRMPEEWYGSDESIRVAENVLLYQRNAGGWPKNTAMHLVLSDDEKIKILQDKELADAIFDNSATTTELRFLARMYKKTGTDKYRAAFAGGLDFILKAQYPNGGWPMFYPLRKGYYTHITFNDNAIVNILTLLGEIKNGNKLYSGLITSEQSARINDAFKKGIEIILRTQIRSNGKLTVWCAQHDENTLLPAKARSYELPSFSGAESVGIIKFLMSLENPSDEIVNSVKGAIEWFDKHRIKNSRWDLYTNADGQKDRRIVYDPAAGDLWARFYDLETGEPFVCDRDGIKKKSLEEIGYERRNGYSWYTDSPEEILKKYPDWKSKWNIK